MQRTFASVMGLALLLSANVASAAQKSSFQQRGANAYLLAGEQIDSCKNWSITSSLAETTTRDEPGAPETTNTALVYFQLNDDCSATYKYFQLNLADAAKLQGNVTSASLKLDLSVTVFTCSYDGETPCTESTLPLTGAIAWASSGSPEHTKSNVINQGPGLQTRFRVSGNTRDSTNSGSFTLDGQTYTLTADNTLSSYLTGNALAFISITRN